ncbi:MAG TPA: TIR domain-containing protein [Pyrinomonadaceae bacterium]|jgi:hypothetical protein
MSTNNPGSVELFISYAHEDEQLRQELTKHLANLRRLGVVKEWHDREIPPGGEWDKEIDEHLKSARIILLLISPDFMASDYCNDVEVKQALERHKKGEAVVIPVVLRSVDWEGAPFRKLQALPKDAKPVASWPDRDQAMTEVARGIRRVAERLTGKVASGDEPAAREEGPGGILTQPPAGKLDDEVREPSAKVAGTKKAQPQIPDEKPQGEAGGLLPMRVLREAIRAVPAVKYALGVAGVGAAVSIIAGFQLNLSVAVIGIVLMFGLMIILVIFSSFARSTSKSLKPLALTLAWSFVTLTVATSFFIFTGFFFAWPRPLDQTAARIIGTDATPTPSPTHTPPATPTPAQATRTLNYSIQVCKPHTDPQCRKPFPLAGEINFEARYRIKLHVSSPQPGFLYVINEGPQTSRGLPQYVMLFPTERVNDGSAGIDADRVLTFPGESDKWLKFDPEEGKEKLWLVWSSDRVGELEAAARMVAARKDQDRGAVTVPGDIAAVRDALARHSATPPKVTRSDELKRTEVEARGDTLVYALVLEHH